MEMHNARQEWENRFWGLVKFLVFLHFVSVLIVYSLFSPAGYTLEGYSSPPASLLFPTSGSSPNIGNTRLPGSLPTAGGQQGEQQIYEESPDFREFIDTVSNGESSAVRGVYLEGVFALPVIQQPETKPTYVSNRSGFVTQFGVAANYGVTGLLAHNYLAGKEFYKLHPGQEALIVYGDRLVRRYKVAEVGTYQKLNPTRLHSDYQDLGTDRQLSASEVFKRFYRGEHHLTFQTCLEKDGLLNWGLLFVRAVPVDS